MAMYNDKGLPLATALRETLSRGYSLDIFGRDLLAGLIVSLVALPLSMALAIAVGLAPQYGIYTAIVAGIVTPLLGGSVTQVSGPTAAFVVIVAPIIAQYGLRGIIITEIMAGLILIVLAWARLGRFINFIPYPVTTGFTSGIAVVLGTLSLNDLLGLGIQKLQGSYIDKVLLLLQHLSDMRWQEASIGILSLIIMCTGKYITPRVPSVVLAITVATLFGIAFQHAGIDVATIGNRFTYETAEGVVRHGIPPLTPTFHFFGGEGMYAWPNHAELRLLLMPAVVIAALAALESLLSATVSDGLSHTRHDPNAELAAIGIANVLSGFASGMPATGAIARTTTNIKSGARTPLASSMHAILIMLYVLALSPVISYMPMASLSALLVLTAYNMSHYRQFYRILTIAPRQDIIVLLACFGLTVFVDMVAGVSVGVMLAALLFWATAGGMGMTGIIEELTLKLKRISSSSLRATTYRVDSLEDMVAAFEHYRDQSDYMVGWIDHMAKGDDIGRGIFEAASHMVLDEGGEALDDFKAPKSRFSIPFMLPGFLLNRYSMALYNKWRFKKYSAWRQAELVSFSHFFHPLDRVGRWNRLYGRRGFFQYQCLLPETPDIVAQLRTLLSAIHRNGLFSFLAVIKYHREGKGMLTFPKRGYSVSLDFPNTRRVRKMLPQLDEWIADHGGRVYLAKDATLSPELFYAMYGEKANDWYNVIHDLDPGAKFTSLMSERLGWKQRA